MRDLEFVVKRSHHKGIMGTKLTPDWDRFESSNKYIKKECPRYLENRCFKF